MNSTTENDFRQFSLIAALIPIFVLIALLAINVIIYSADSSYGPNQIALLLAAVSAFSVSLFALGSATARTLLRTSNLDPGERSMFTTRFACFCV
ncbi:MAG: hypothetical protein AAF939_09455, partial [Planctomycetota bacterium]